MELLILALVFQFILKIWPKRNLIVSPYFIIDLYFCYDAAKNKGSVKTLVYEHYRCFL